ncbi:ester cyclase [Kutzneria sp. NPDC052558]|uniref:ester cyclase n=1 Tax=Kutzneria sp. NPDC052558 TaxID=3364121 RepID=UPI0037CC7CDB
MTREQNVRTLRLLLDLVNRQAFDRLDEVYAYDLVDHDPAPDHGGGFEGLRRSFVGLSECFPDLHLEEDVVIADGEFVAMVYRLSGTQRGRFHGVAATGHRVETRGMVMARFADGKIAERWGAVDDLAILGRLNVSVPS